MFLIDVSEYTPLQQLSIDLYKEYFYFIYSQYEIKRINIIIKNIFICSILLLLSYILFLI